MLSFVTNPDGDVTYIHADVKGLTLLERTVAQLKRALEVGNCEHSHLFSETWGSSELSETMLLQEREANCRQVHHVEIYAWTDEWRERHGL